MKDQDPNQERQVATQDPTQSREQAQAEQQYQHDQQPRPEFQSVEQRQPKLLGGLRVIAGDEANQPGEILVGQFGYEDFESHDWRFFSTCSKGMTLP